MGGTKRFHVDDDERRQLRSRVLGQMALITERTVAELADAAAASPTSTLLELGLTSAMGISLKGWVFKELEAELTTFQMLKQPLDDVVASIDNARREALGASIPQLGQLPPREV